MPETSVPWYRKPAFLHTLDTSLGWLAGIAALGVGPGWLKIAGKAAAVVLQERQIPIDLSPGTPIVPTPEGEAPQ